jgi:hypothetical protein
VSQQQRMVLVVVDSRLLSCHVIVLSCAHRRTLSEPALHVSELGPDGVSSDMRDQQQQGADLPSQRLEAAQDQALSAVMGQRLHA